MQNKAVNAGSYTAYISIGAGADEKKAKIDFAIIDNSSSTYYAIPNTGIE